MIKIKLVSGTKSYKGLAEEIVKDSPEKWGDNKNFLSRLFSKGEIIAIARDDNNSIAGFSLAKKIITKESIVIAFLATRILPEFRNKRIAKTLIRKITQYFIFKYKFLSLLNWLKPVYFVTATANPVVFESLRKRLNIILDYDHCRRPDNTEVNIARSFTEIIASKERFSQEDFICRGVFLGSAESYNREEDIPWSDNTDTNSFLKEKLKLKEKNGDGIIILSKLM